MKQVFRRVLDNKGVIKVAELPAPHYGDNQVLIATDYTVISAGTEGATLSKTFPELVKQTIQDPWMRNAVKNLIFGSSPAVVKNIVWDETTLMRAIGYSGSGTVVKVGNNVADFQPGDKVAFAAEGHAEIVAPSKNYVVPVPDNVSQEEAAFVTLGGIALQGVRRAEIQLGEHVAILGLGLVGLLVAQLVAAAGGQVTGIDINEQRLDMLKQLVPDAILINSNTVDAIKTARHFSNGQGADVVIICASSKDPSVANQAMKMARKQGRVVFVGIVKMHLERMPFFRNELDLRFSRAYGPGCMEPDYEKGNIEYPYHYIRWTQQHNLAEFLRLIAIGKVQLRSLIGGNFAIEDAQQAYDELYSDSFNGAAALLKYENSQAILAKPANPQVTINHKTVNKDKIRIGVIGCGNFTRGTHLPNLHKNPDFQIAAIASSTGVNAVSVCKQFSIPYSTTDYAEILNDNDIDAVLITTRHNLHADIACQALAAGKHVMVEKPAALNWQQHQQLETALQRSDCFYMVGYNRRYAPLAKTLKSRLHAELPLIIHYQVCVPEIPDDHWTLNPLEGGGRLIGEAEHFFDFLNFITDNNPLSVAARCLCRGTETINTQFNFSVDIQYPNAIGSVVYTSFAAPGSARETITVYQAEQTFILEDFKLLTITANKKKKIRNAFGDMGHKAELTTFTTLLKNGQQHSQLQSPLAASKISLQALDYLKNTKITSS